MPDDIGKLAQIIVNSFKSLEKKIDFLVNKKPERPVIHMPEMRIPDIILPPYPQPVAPVINFPDMPAPIVNVEKADAPIVNVAAPIIPPANITVEPAKVEFPKEMQVKGIKELGDKIDELINQEVKNPISDISSKKPMAVMVVDKKGNQISDFGGEFSAPNMVSLRVGTDAVDAESPLPITDGLGIPAHDQLVLSYDGSNNLTGVIYKLAGVTVNTLTLSYTGSNLTNVVKS